MYKRSLCIILLFLSTLTSLSAQAPPTVETLKQVLTKKLMKLTPGGSTERNVLFLSVQAGSANSGTYPFKVTAVVRDYGAGYPKNHYYGTTCVGHLDEQVYTLLKDDFGGWDVQGVMTPPMATNQCKNNPAEGVSAIPLNTLQGTQAGPAQAANAAPVAPVGMAAATPAAGSSGSALRQGEWACYGSGGRALIGLGFKITSGSTYTDLDNKSRGTYNYNSGAGTITFNGGHLAGQVAKAVGGNRFNIGTTTCQPNR